MLQTCMSEKRITMMECVTRRVCVVTAFIKLPFGGNECYECCYDSNYDSFAGGYEIINPFMTTIATICSTYSLS